MIIYHFARVGAKSIEIFRNSEVVTKMLKSLRLMTGLGTEKVFDSGSILRWREDWVRKDRDAVCHEQHSYLSLSEKIQGCSAKKDVSVPCSVVLLSVYQMWKIS